MILDKLIAQAAPTPELTRRRFVTMTIGGAVGLAMIDAAEPITKNWIESGNWQVDIAGQRFPAIASIRPMYDPTAQRIKG